MRSQIDQLPSSPELYVTITEIQKELCEKARENPLSLVVDYCLALTTTVRVDCPVDYASELGYPKELEKLHGDSKDVSVPPYIAQAMELLPPEELEYYDDLYWKDILSMTRKTLFCDARL